MVRTGPIVGVATIFWALSVASANAKTVLYEINGQRFSYSTNNRAQVRVARERINAANAAAAARANANAELAANPLVRVFGSKADNEAKAAQARLNGVLASAGSTPEPIQVRSRSPTATGLSSSRQTTRGSRQTAHGSGQTPHATRDVSLKTGRAANRAPRNASIQEPVGRSTRAIMTGSVREPRPDANLERSASIPKIEAIVFDFASNIKTVHRADGSVEEDTFEPSAAAKLKRGRRAAGPEIRFVNESPDLATDITGETEVPRRP